MEWRDWEDQILKDHRFFSNLDVATLLLPHRTEIAVRHRRKALGVGHLVHCKKCAAPMTRTNGADICSNCTKSFKRQTNITLKYTEYRIGASKRGHKWDLTLIEFVKLWNSHCSYCNVKIHGIGIDRIDSSVGYTVKNVVPCCTTCNKMKGTMPVIDWINAITRIVDYGSRNDKSSSG